MKERQVSFAAGELSPTLWGRTDLERYQAGARTLNNFVVTPHGVIANRTGTQFAGYTQGTHKSNGQARLIPFIVSETDSWILVLSENRARLIREDQDDNRYSFEETDAIITPWSYAEALDIRYAQTGTTLTLVHKDYAPRELTLTSGSPSTISLSVIDFDIPAAPAPADTDLYGPMLLDVGILSLGVPGKEGNAAKEERRATLGVGSQEGDESHPARDWSWKITYIVRGSDGILYETTGFDIVEKRVRGVNTNAITFAVGDPDLDSYDTRWAPESIAVYPDWAQKIRIPPRTKINAVLPSGHNAIAARVYRGRGAATTPENLLGGDGTAFGYVGQASLPEAATDSTKQDQKSWSTAFTDEGDLPDFSTPPPQGFNPFQRDDPTTPGATIYEYPSVVTFYEGRRYFASSDDNPSRIWASSVDQYNNFDEVILPDDADAMTFTLADDSYNEIRALVPRKALLVMTSSSEWAIVGTGDNGIIRPGGVSAKPLSKHGVSATVPPLSAAENVFFVQRKGVTPRVLTAGQDGIRSTDLALLSRHLFNGYTIKDWAYAEDPYSTLWVVRSDGKLLSLTYIPDQGMYAWAQHDIAGGGRAESVASKPEELEDAVYVVVSRDGPGVDKTVDAYRTIERIAYRDFEEIRHAVYLDQATSYNGQNLTAFTIAFTDPGADEGVLGEILTMTFSGAASISVGDRILIYDEDGGLPYIFRIATSPGGNVYTAQVMQVPEPDTAIPAAWFNAAYSVAATDWYKAVNSVNGVTIPNGTEVKAVVDGDVIEGLTVIAGVVGLGEYVYGGTIHVGRAYNADFESLSAVQERGRQKIVREVTLELERTRGGSIGAALDEKLEDLRTRQVSDIYKTLEMKREEHRVLIQDKWAEEGRIAFRQSDPMPVTILGLMRDYEHGG